MRPIIDGGWWRIASNPDLGEWTSEEQEPVDFGVWQAADGSWQLWSCIRKTKHPGRTRVFYGWEGRDLRRDEEWKPTGIKFTGDGTVGETVGGMQAPYVIRVAGEYRMYYGDYRHICLALSADGKTFHKELTNGLAGLFGEGPGGLARDPMLMKIGPRWYCYYSAHPDGKHGIWLRTSDDLARFSDPRRVMAGGQAGGNWWNFECPHVVHVCGAFYLFHTQNYAPGKQQASVYRSLDPTYFGIEDDSNFVCHLPVAAPELVFLGGKWYLAALSPELDGIRVSKLRWAPEGAETETPAPTR
ncbi:hypothetical protein BH23VER1_BH23VER1_04080 [soil metagenome]